MIFCQMSSEILSPKSVSHLSFRDSRFVRLCELSSLYIPLIICFLSVLNLKMESSMDVEGRDGKVAELVMTKSLSYMYL